MWVIALITGFAVGVLATYWRKRIAVEEAHRKASREAWDRFTNQQRRLGRAIYNRTVELAERLFFEHMRIASDWPVDTAKKLAHQSFIQAEVFTKALQEYAELKEQGGPMTNPLPTENEI